MFARVENNYGQWANYHQLCYVTLSGVRERVQKNPQAINLGICVEGSVI